MDENLYILCGEVLDLTDFDASFVGGFLDAFAERVYRFSVGEFGDGDGFAIALFHSCTHFDGSSTKSVIIARNVDESAGLEIGIEGEIFFLQIRDGGLAEFAKVVGKDFSTQPHSDAFCSLGEQEGEFHGQRNGFLVATIVREFPLCGFGIEQHIEGKLGESSFDVTRSCGLISSEDVSPRTLAVDEQILASHLGECIHNGGITVGVKFHSFTGNVGYFVVASIVHSLHRVQDAALHGFETIVEMGHCALQNHIGGVIEKPVLIHSSEGMHIHCFILFHLCWVKIHSGFRSF